MQMLDEVASVKHFTDEAYVMISNHLMNLNRQYELESAHRAPDRTTRHRIRRIKKEVYTLVEHMRELMHTRRTLKNVKDKLAGVRMQMAEVRREQERARNGATPNEQAAAEIQRRVQEIEAAYASVRAMMAKIDDAQERRLKKIRRIEEEQQRVRGRMNML